MKAKAVKIKRGRPTSVDKYINMTVCLSKLTHNNLSRVAKVNKLPKATMARKIIEENVE
jgi:hypothetical protein